MTSRDTVPRVAMTRERLLGWTSLGALLATLGAFGACSSNAHPGSLISSTGGSTPNDFSGGASGRAGSNAAGANGGGGGSSTVSGDAGEDGAAPQAVAVYPSQLEADVGCDMTTPDASLLITNTGDEPLVISSASADSGYVVKTTLPLTIAPGAGENLLITPPALGTGADAGATTSGKLSFSTNEPGMPTHVVTLTSAAFMGSFEFTDSNGMAINTLSLSYGGSLYCPDLATYRIHNTGNVTFTVFGPTFPAHFAGASLGANGEAIPPDGFAELTVSGVSAPGSACSGTGALSFTVMGPFCGAVPTLNVDWPASTEPDAGSTCSCTVSP
jgi:hypothetical protein